MNTELNQILAPRNYNWYSKYSLNIRKNDKLINRTLSVHELIAEYFVPNNDPCLPGGSGKAYALNYKTAAAVIDFDNDTNKERSIEIGGGIPSKVVTVITDAGGVKLLVSVGSTNPDAFSESFGAGVVTIDPLVPPVNFFYLWWR